MDKKEIIEILLTEDTNFLPRMKAEKELLLDGIRKTNAFLYSEEGLAMPDNDRNCLKRQTNIMDSYLDILNIRIYNAEADAKVKAELEAKAKAKSAK